MKRKERPAARPFELRIEKLVYGGWGLGRHRGKVIFSPFAAPGDRVEVRAESERKNYIMVRPVRILEPGPGRQAPACRHFESCGGCQWQHLAYAHQLEAKRVILAELIHHRFPATRDAAVAMQESPRALEYRSRARIRVDAAEPPPKVGFLRFQSHRVEDIEMCPLLRPVLNRGLAQLRQEVRSNPPPFAAGFVELAGAQEQDLWSATTLRRDPMPAGSRRAAMEDTSERPLRRKVGHFDYWVRPSVFFQANDFMVEGLIDLVSRLSRDAGTGTALDLFAGVGLFSLPLAQCFHRVVAVEGSPTACGLLRENSSAAGCGNIEVECAEVNSWLERAASMAPPQLELILLDPPRVGAGRGVMQHIAAWAPQSVIYVSCDPQTLVRDLAPLCHGGYVIDFIEGLDLFPQTFHFETVVRLRKR